MGSPRMASPGISPLQTSTSVLAMDDIKDYQYTYVLIVFDDIDVDHY